MAMVTNVTSDDALAVHVTVSSNFDGGAIAGVESRANVRGAGVTAVHIKRDEGGAAMHFAFRAGNLRRGTKYQFALLGADRATYAEGWASSSYKVWASEDLENWFQVEDTTHPGEANTGDEDEHPDALRWSIVANTTAVTFAYYPLYTAEQTARLCARAQSQAPDMCRWCPSVLPTAMSNVGADVLFFGSPPPHWPGYNQNSDANRPMIWIICRQHPGESQASWVAEGFVKKLLDDEPDGLAAVADIAVVPCINQGGASAGAHRHNLAGADLNRAWGAPNAATSPEVLACRAAVTARRTNVLLDIHADESLPAVFRSHSAHGVPGISKDAMALRNRFDTELLKRCPDFQTEIGYTAPPPGKANTNICANWATETFPRALAACLEVPYGSVAHRPERGAFSPARCRELGVALVGTLESILPHMNINNY